MSCVSVRSKRASAFRSSVAQMLDDQEQKVRWSIASLDSTLTSLGVTRPMVVVSTHALEASGLRPALYEQLGNRPVITFVDFSPNPKIEEAYEAVRIAREHKADGFVAVGGGSCIDIAKLAALGIAQIRDDLAEVLQGKVSSSAPPLPLVAAPTTAGTGSEATPFAAVYVNGNKKISVGHPQMRPQCAILDSRFIQVMPEYLAACTGLDALSQAAESIWAVGATDESLRYARRALEISVGSLVESTLSARLDPREHILASSHLAGRAIAISKTTASHAMSYQLTQRYGVPHGHAVALTLGHLAFHNAFVSEDDCADPRGYKDVQDRVHAACSIFNATPQDMPETIKEILMAMSLPSTLRAVGVEHADIPSLAQAVDPVRLSNNPRLMSTQSLEELLRRAW